ncbi:MAG: hypothetical protein ACI4C1_10430 [Lachnospiraceae bacterium]
MIIEWQRTKDFSAARFCLHFPTKLYTMLAAHTVKEQDKERKV